MSTITKPVASGQPDTPGSEGRPPKYRRPLGIGRDTAVHYAVLLGLAVFVLAPIIPTLLQSIRSEPLYEEGGVFTLDGYKSLFTDAGFGQVVVNTALFAGLTTVLTLVIAIPMAVVVVRTQLPGGRFIAMAMQWPFFISSLILGFGWILMYGPAGFISTEVRNVFGGVPWNLYSIPGMAITEAVALAPIAYVFCANALRQSDASLESAAQVCGAGPLRILGQVIIPMLRPPMVYSSILVFSMSVETLSVPLLYGQPVGIDVFSTFLYRNGLQSVNPDYSVLGAASVVILCVTISLVAVQAKLLKDAQRFVSVRGKATRPRKLDLGWLKWVSIVAIAFYVIFGALIPIVGLMFRSFTLIFTPLRNPFDFVTMKNYQTVFRFESYVQSIWNSLIVAGVGSVVISILAVLAVMVARRSTFKYARVVEYLALIPQSVPGHHHRHRVLLGLRLRAVRSRAGAARNPGRIDHRVRAARPAQCLRLHRPVDDADRHRAGQRRPSGGRRLDHDVLPDPAGPHHPGIRGGHGPDVRDHAQGVLAGCLPQLGRQQRPRNHHARALGTGQHRIRRGTRHHPDRHHRDVRRTCRPADEGKAQCLSSPSPTSPRPSATTPYSRASRSQSRTESSSRCWVPAGAGSPPP